MDCLVSIFFDVIKGQNTAESSSGPFPPRSTAVQVSRSAIQLLPMGAKGIFLDCVLARGSPGSGRK
jgi:hypothetical protein